MFPGIRFQRRSPTDFSRFLCYLIIAKNLEAQFLFLLLKNIRNLAFCLQNVWPGCKSNLRLQTHLQYISNKENCFELNFISFQNEKLTIYHHSQINCKKFKQSLVMKLSLKTKSANFNDLKFYLIASFMDGLTFCGK